MLPKKNRFQFKSKLPSKLFNSQSFSIRYNKNEEELKVGVVVSKKVDKSAVVRNRIKRVIIESVRTSFANDKKLTLVFYARSAAKESALAEEVKEVINKIV